MAYKDKDKQREAECKQCGKKVHTIGTKPRIFCSDKCRKAWSRQEKTDRITNGQEQTDILNSTVIGITAKGLVQGMAEPLKVSLERTAQGNIRVSKPGDADYVPQCETTRAFIEGRDKRPEVGKRGKDIKYFGDLPVYVQEDINRMSFVDGKFSETIKANRTAIAINYQYQFPDRFHSTGVI